MHSHKLYILILLLFLFTSIFSMTNFIMQKELTLFPGSAELSFITKANILKGYNSIIITNLPKNFYNININILNKEVKLLYYSLEPSYTQEEYSNYLAQLKDLNEQKSAVEYVLDILKKQVSNNNPNNVIQSLPDFEREFYVKTKKLNDILTQIEKLNNEWRKKTESYYLKINYFCDRNSFTDITIKFLTANSYFTTFYRIEKISGNENKLFFDQFTEIIQNSGILWTNRIFISTYNPSYNITPIQEQREEINFKEIYPVKKMSMEMPQSRNIISEASEKDDSFAPQTTVENSEYGSLFEVFGNYSINGEGKPERILLSQFQIDCNYIYELISPENSRFYIKSIFTNNNNFTIMRGEFDAFNDNMLIGKGYLNNIPINDSYELYLGFTENLNVKRSLVSRKLSQGLTGNTETYTYRILIKNNSKNDIEFYINERIPYPAIPDIKFKLINIKPNTNITGNINRLNWKLLSKSGSETEINYTYEINYPKDKKIVFNIK